MMHLAMAQLDLHSPPHSKGSASFAADAHQGAEDPFDLFVDAGRCASHGADAGGAGSSPFAADEGEGSDKGWSTLLDSSEQCAASSPSSPQGAPLPSSSSSSRVMACCHQPVGRASSTNLDVGQQHPHQHRRYTRDAPQKQASGRSISFPSSTSSSAAASSSSAASSSASSSLAPASTWPSHHHQHQQRSLSAGQAAATLPPSTQDTVAPTDMAQTIFSRSDFHDFWLQRTQHHADGFGAPSSYFNSEDLYSPHTMLKQTQQIDCSLPFRPSRAQPEMQSQYTPTLSTPMTSCNSQDLSNMHMATSGPNTPYAHAVSSTHFPFNYDSSSSPDAPWQEEHSPAFSSPASLFDDSKVQPWWPPAPNAVSARGQPCSTRASPAYHDSPPPHPGSLNLGPSQFDEALFPDYESNGLLLLQSNDASDHALSSSHPDRLTPFSECSNDVAAARQKQRSSSSRQPSHSPSPQSLAPSTTTPSQRGRDRSRGHARGKASGSSNGSSSRQPSVGFVNYTADDSRKLLTGVAPSGSSKTKARREKEAAEKRKRLSLAATKIVLEAGGDIKALERAGII